MTEILWNQCSAQAWQAFYDQAGYAAFQQHYAYGEIIRAAGGVCHRAIVQQDGKPVAIAQITGRRRFGMVTIAVCMRGPLWLTVLRDDEKSAIYDQLRRSCTLRFPRLLLWMPEEAGGQEALTQVVTPYHTILWDLRPEKELLKAALEGKWRHRLMQAQNQALVVKDVAAAEIQWLLQEEQEQAGNRRYSGISPQLLPAWQHQCGNRGVLVLAAEHGGERVAGVACVIHGHQATYQIGWNGDKGRELAAHNLLLWQTALRLKARGIRFFDLGGVNTEDIPGITRFKMGTGGQVISLPGTFL